MDAASKRKREEDGQARKDKKRIEKLKQSTKEAKEVRTVSVFPLLDHPEHPNGCDVAGGAPAEDSV